MVLFANVGKRSHFVCLLCVPRPFQPPVSAGKPVQKSGPEKRFDLLLAGARAGKIPGAYLEAAMKEPSRR